MAEQYQHLRARQLGIILVVVGFCALQVFESWKDLGRPLRAEGSLDLFFMALVAAAGLKLLTIFRGPRERFLVGLTIAGIAASLFNPIARLARYVFFVLWILALLMGLSMLVWPPAPPRIKGGTGKIKQRMLILAAVVISAIILGALIYFIPFH